MSLLWHALSRSSRSTAPASGSGHAHGRAAYAGDIAGESGSWDEGGISMRREGAEDAWVRGGRSERVRVQECPAPPVRVFPPSMAAPPPAVPYPAYGQGPPAAKPGLGRPHAVPAPTPRHPNDGYYGHSLHSTLCSRFITHLFNCPEAAPPNPANPAAPAPPLPLFIAYAIHRTRLQTPVVYTALFLLMRLKARFPAAKGSSGHRLFISAFMIASKVACDDTYSNKSWTVVGQGMFALREINQMEREMCQYLEWQLVVETPELDKFKRTVEEEYTGPAPYAPFPIAGFVPIAARPTPIGPPSRIETASGQPIAVGMGGSIAVAAPSHSLGAAGPTPPNSAGSSPTDRDRDRERVPSRESFSFVVPPASAPAPGPTPSPASRDRDRERERERAAREARREQRRRDKQAQRASSSLSNGSTSSSMSEIRIPLYPPTNTHNPLPTPPNFVPLRSGSGASAGAGGLAAPKNTPPDTPSPSHSTTPSPASITDVWPATPTGELDTSASITVVNGRSPSVPHTTRAGSGSASIPPPAQTNPAEIYGGYRHGGPVPPPSHSHSGSTGSGFSRSTPVDLTMPYTTSPEGDLVGLPSHPHHPSHAHQPHHPPHSQPNSHPSSHSHSRPSSGSGYSARSASSMSMQMMNGNINASAEDDMAGLSTDALEPPVGMATELESARRVRAGWRGEVYVPLPVPPQSGSGSGLGFGSLKGEKDGAGAGAGKEGGKDGMEVDADEKKDGKALMGVSGSGSGSGAVERDAHGDVPVHIALAAEAKDAHALAGTGGAGGMGKEEWRGKGSWACTVAVSW